MQIPLNEKKLIYFPISGCNAVCFLSLLYKETYEKHLNCRQKEQQQQQQLGDKLGLRKEGDKYISQHHYKYRIFL
jgi:hypothetical protein